MKCAMIYALHGAVGHADDWKNIASSLAGSDGVRMSRVDLWRYLMCCPMSLTEFAAAFNKEVMAQTKHSDEKPVLLGYSMGGRLALHVLLDNPSLWGGAVIVSAHTGIDVSERSARLASDAEWAAKAIKGEWKTFVEEWNGQGVLDNDVMPNRNNLEQRRQPVARSFMDWSLGQQEDLLENLGSEEISCPVLWVVGEGDQKFTQVGKKAVARIPSAELKVMSGAGHRVPWENSEAFASLLGDWLAKENLR